MRFCQFLGVCKQTTLSIKVVNTNLEPDLQQDTSPYVVKSFNTAKFHLHVERSQVLVSNKKFASTSTEYHTADSRSGRIATLAESISKKSSTVSESNPRFSYLQYVRVHVLHIDRNVKFQALKNRIQNSDLRIVGIGSAKTVFTTARFFLEARKYFRPILSLF